MWGWLSGIADGITSIWETLVNLPGLIIDGIEDFFSPIFQWFEDIWNAILELPEKFAELLKEIFIPDTDYIDSAFNEFLLFMKEKCNFDTSFFENLFDNEAPVTDIYTDYNIPNVGNFKFKILDTSFFIDGVNYFRPFIRGFIVLMMCLYHIRQLVGFFGYDAGVVAGRGEAIAEARKAQKGE